MSPSLLYSFFFSFVRQEPASVPKVSCKNKDISSSIFAAKRGRKKIHHWVETRERERETFAFAAISTVYVPYYNGGSQRETKRHGHGPTTQSNGGFFAERASAGGGGGMCGWGPIICLYKIPVIRK